MDKYMLKKIVEQNGDSLSKLADYLGIHINTLYEKMKADKYEFTRDQIQQIKEKYNLTSKEVDSIFFS